MAELVEEIREQIAAVRRAMEEIEASGADAGGDSEGVRLLRRAVDDVRRSVWAVLSAEHEGNLAAYLGEVRLARARVYCEDLLADLYAETLSPGAPGLGDFVGALRAVAKTCGERGW